jgi:hypothetical protein
MATTQLRLRGVTLLHLAAATLSAVPLLFLTWQVAVLHRVLRQPALFAFAALIAALPWLSRALARSAYRAKFDDVAVHVRGEALPYKTITAVTVEKTARRHVLTLARGQTVTLQLVLWDAFAGRLEPRDALAKKLADHGHSIDGGTG